MKEKDFTYNIAHVTDLQKPVEINLDKGYVSVESIFSKYPANPITGLSVDSIEEGDVSLSWSDVSGAQYRTYVNGESRELIESSNMELLDLNAGEYTLAVAAVVDSQIGQKSEEVSFTLTSEIPNFSYSISDTVDLIWDKSDIRIDGYNVYIDGVKYNDDLIEATEYSIPDLIGVYEIYVAAVRDGEEVNTTDVVEIAANCDIELDDVLFCDLSIFEVSYARELCDIGIDDVIYCDIHIEGIERDVCDLIIEGAAFCDLTIDSLNRDVCDLNIDSVDFCDLEVDDILFCDLEIDGIATCDLAIDEVAYCDININDIEYN